MKEISISLRELTQSNTQIIYFLQFINKIT